MTQLLQTRPAPRLVVKVLCFSFSVITIVLGASLLLLLWETRDRVLTSVVATLEAGQTRLGQLQVQRQRERRLQAATLAENPTLKAAVDTYVSEGSSDAHSDQLRETIQRELEKLRETMSVPVVALTTPRGLVIASAGPGTTTWGARQVLAPSVADSDTPTEAVIKGSQPMLATIVPLRLGLDPVAQLVLASPIDDTYATELSAAAGTNVVVRVDRRVVASSAAASLREAADGTALPTSGELVTPGNERVIVRRLMAVDDADVYALESITMAVRRATADTAWMFAEVGSVALVLAIVGSLWLARKLSSPIDELRNTLEVMARERDFERALPVTGTSYELDALGATFNDLRRTIADAEAESESTYLGVIGVLATALDARDPYTAGHSERVSTLSVAIARELHIPEHDVEVVRLGALLHDIGKIGVPDAVLRKPGTLTDEEFDQIKQHPSLGARILRPLHFLADHVAIVELHHEQPDGRGYPFGLVGEATPLYARIVHVADAFDAMTTARAYRPGRPVNEAMAELWRHAGTLFDASVVQAFSRVDPVLLHKTATATTTAAAEGTAPNMGGALVPFRLRAQSAQRESVG